MLIFLNYSLIDNLSEGDLLETIKYFFEESISLVFIEIGNPLPIVVGRYFKSCQVF